MNSYPTEPGWYEGLDIGTYLRIPALSASGLEQLRRSPAHLRWALDNPQEPTDAMKIGSALHLALLEPHLFEGRYVPLLPCEAELKSGGRKGEECGKTSRVYRSGRCYCGTHDPEPGEPLTVEVMPAEALERVEGMKRAVLEHPDARRFFVGKGRSEVIGIWVDEATGVRCKIRLDREIDRTSIHGDVKTCVDASKDAFPRHAARMGYPFRASWYRRGMEALGKPAIGSLLIAVEKTPPFGCQTFLLDEDDLRKIGDEIDGHLRTYAACLEHNEWPAYPSGFRHLKLAPWHLPEAEYDDESHEEAA